MMSKHRYPYDGGAFITISGKYARAATLYDGGRPFSISGGNGKSVGTN